MAGGGDRVAAGVIEAFNKFMTNQNKVMSKFNITLMVNCNTSASDSCNTTKNQ